MSVSDEPRSAVRGRPSTRNALLAIITVILGAFALRETAAVTLPLAFSVFLIALHWPLQRRLVRIMPRGIGVVLSLVVFLAVVSGFVWLILESADEVKDSASDYRSRITSMVGSAKSFLAERGIDVPFDGGGTSGALASVAKGVSGATFDFLGGAVLVIAFLGLGLLEVRDFKRKVQMSAPRAEEGRWAGVLKRIGREFQRYVVVRTGIGVITGAGCAAGAWLIGLDFWYIWGLLNFLLNYIPTLGSIIGVVPPTLFALIQFQDPLMALLTLAVVGGVQLVMGNWVDPLLQGRYLSLSPLVVLLSVTFWGWVWGIPGALIGVPLTIVAVLTCREFDATRWIATLLAELPEEEREREEESRKAERASEAPAEAE